MHAALLSVRCTRPFSQSVSQTCLYPYLPVVPGADCSVEGSAVQPLLSADMSEVGEDALRAP